MFAELKSIIKDLKELPTVPRVSSQILKLMEDPRHTLKKLADLIAMDPSMSAMILKTANSAYYRRDTEVTTLDRAIVVIGEKNLKELVINVCMKSFANVTTAQERALQEDSLACAIAARVIAQALGHPEPEEAFLAGMFRHVGKMAMLSLFPDLYRMVLDMAKKNESDIPDVEQDLFGFNHAAIGAAVMDCWNFSSNLVQTTLHHHDFIEVDLMNPDQAQDPYVYNLSAIINLAEGMCEYLGIGVASAHSTLELDALPGAIVLSLESEQIFRMLDSVRKAWDNR